MGWCQSWAQNLFVDAEAPRAMAICDQCGQLWSKDDLRWQFDWRGPQLQNLHILVCPGCLSEPATFLKTVVIPPDPEPLYNVRPLLDVGD
jgi:hypothetical protein